MGRKDAAMGFDTSGRIRQLLAARSWSIYRLAEQAHTPQSTLSDMFSRGNQPSLATLKLICDAPGLTLAIDRQVVEREYFGCHPCRNTSSVKLKTVDVLETFLKHTGHEPIIVEL
jgi:transcriptional regulator with XRE-family HTH domain